MKNGLGLATKASLLSIVTPFSLCVQRILALLVLGDFVKRVLLALLRDAKGLTRLRDDNLMISMNSGDQSFDRSIARAIGDGCGG